MRSRPILPNTFLLAGLFLVISSTVALNAAPAPSILGGFATADELYTCLSGAASVHLLTNDVMLE